MIFGQLKNYLLATLAGLATLLAFLLKIFGSRLKQQKQRADQAEARVDHALSVMEEDKEIEREHDIRTEELADEIERDGTSDELSNPDRW